MKINNFLKFSFKVSLIYFIILYAHNNKSNKYRKL